MFMEKELLWTMSSTAQVRFLMEELLGDGEEHTRKEVVEYVQRKRQEMGLPPCREGHLAGGIRQAVAELECQQSERGRYRLKKPGTTVSYVPKTRRERAAEVCADAISRLRQVAREIDYISAGEDELEELKDLKACVEAIDDWQAKLRGQTE